MAHYVFQRNNGYGDFDYISNFNTMELTDYKEYAAQVDDKYLPYIDMAYLNSLGFYAVGITALALRINPLELFIPLVRNFRPVGIPRPPRARGAAPRPMIGRPIPVPPPKPAPRPLHRPAPAPRPAAPRPAPLPKPAAPKPAPARAVAPKPAPRPAVGPKPAGGKGPGGRGPGGRGLGR